MFDEQGGRVCLSLWIGAAKTRKPITNTTLIYEYDTSKSIKSNKNR